MTDEFTLNPIEIQDVPLLNRLHKLAYGSVPVARYYGDMHKEGGPFYAAVSPSNELIGFIATRVKHEKSEIYIASLAIEEDYRNEGIELALSRRVLKEARKVKAKAVTMHTRESNTELIKALKRLKFKTKDSGKYKDGEKKLKLVKTYKAKKSDFKLKKKKGVRTYGPSTFKPKPPPKKGVFTIRKILTKDIYKVERLHNMHMGRKRAYAYFKRLSEFDPCYFWVAADSNDDLIGYAVARPQRISGLKKGPYTRLNFVSMTVEEKWRGLGIAMLLIDDLFKAARENKNIEYIYGHVRETNTEALTLYRKMGFRLKQIGTYEDDGKGKVMLIRRYRFPSLKPYWLKYGDYVKWFMGGVVAHEVIHSVRDYD